MLRAASVMSSKLGFNGRVAIVTGAGGGLGKTYALLLASKGASVVVNDLGGAATGGGGSSRPADNVVEEIIRQGGRAVGNYDSVEEGHKIVKTAIDKYGRVDIVINNAGILRDKTFMKMTEDDWDLVHRVHLRGSFIVTKAAWPYMRQQNYGRVIMTASTSGLYGNFGQANYSAAKLGLLGLSNTVAIEGQKYGIHCNTIVPTAASRLTESVMPQDLFQIVKPDLVAPVVAYLCHEECEETGQVFEVAGGWAAKVRWQQAHGAVLLDDESVSVESVRDNWDKVTDFSSALNHSSTTEALGHMMSLVKEARNARHQTNNLKASSSSSSNGLSSSPLAGVDLSKVKEYMSERTPFTYSERDVILYALGVGAKASNLADLKFLYENHEGFGPLPTYGVITAWKGQSSILSRALPNVDFDFAKMLHGEQYLEIMKPIPPSGTLYCQSRIVDVLDKRSGASIILEASTTDSNNELVCVNQFVIFFVGAGRFNGPRTSPNVKKLFPPPDRQPDAVVEEKTSTDQAAVYRLSGDYNPLHIDPEFAAVGGFDQPILHGMSTFGHSARHVLAKFADNDISKFRAIKARFSNPVLPGQTLRTEMWKEGSRIFYRTLVVETGKVVISGGYVDLFESSSMKQVSSDSPSNAVFEEIKQRIAANPSLVQKVNAVFAFHIMQEGDAVKQWTVDMKRSPGSVTEGPSSVKADCTMIISDTDFVDMAKGKLDGQKAFMSGKLKIKGNVMMSQRLGKLFKDQSKL